jgi:hypothetical protein
VERGLSKEVTEDLTNEGKLMLKQSVWNGVAMLVKGRASSRFIFAWLKERIALCTNIKSFAELRGK